MGLFAKVVKIQKFEGLVAKLVGKCQKSLGVYCKVAKSDENCESWKLEGIFVTLQDKYKKYEILGLFKKIMGNMKIKKFMDLVA